MKIEKSLTGQLLIKDESDEITDIVNTSTLYISESKINTDMILIGSQPGQEYEGNAINVQVSSVSTTIIGGVSTPFSGTRGDLMIWMANNLFT